MTTTTTTDGSCSHKATTISKKLSIGNLGIASTLAVQIVNSTDLKWGAAPRPKSIEFSICTARIDEKNDVHT